MQNSIQLYADGMSVDPDDSKSINVTLTNIDLSQVDTQFFIDDVLDCLEFSDIADYVNKKLADE